MADDPECGVVHCDVLQGAEVERDEAGVGHQAQEHRGGGVDLGVELETNLRDVWSCTITEKPPTMAFLCLEVATTALTFNV